MSGVPPMTETMTGLPQAIASMTETGAASPNPTLDNKNASAPRSS